MAGIRPAPIDMDFDDAMQVDRAGRNGPRVVHKRRRHWVEPEAAAGTKAGGVAAGTEAERAPRVFQLRGAPTAEAPVVDQPTPAGADAAPRPVRRARRDPTHAPGAVTRVVYEAPPPVDSHGEAWDFCGPSAGEYRAVREALERVQQELDMARSARRFRVR